MRAEAVSIPTPSSPSAAGWMSASPSASTPACAIFEAIPETDWLSLPPPMWPTSFQSEADAGVRLIVRRVKPTPGSKALGRSSPTGTEKPWSW